MMTRTNQDRQAWLAGVPQKRVAAGALFLDEAGRLLIVKPTYKPLWNIPGGVIEENESPRQGCQREVREELGLEKALDRLLCVEYTPAVDKETEKLVFIFWGGVLTVAEIAAIRLPADELSEFRFLSVEEALALLPPDKAERVRHSLAMVGREGAVYRETEIGMQ